MNLRTLLHAWVNKTKFGYAGVLEAINATRQTQMGMQVLVNKLNPNSETACPNVIELDLIADVLDLHIPLAEYHAQKANAVVVALPPEGEHMADMNMLEAFMHASVTAGDFAREFTDAWADGRITPDEFEAMRKKVHAQISSQLGLLAKIEQVVR